METIDRAGLVTATRCGKWTHYALNADGFKKVGECLATFSGA